HHIKSHSLTSTTRINNQSNPNQSKSTSAAARTSSRSAHELVEGASLLGESREERCPVRGDLVSGCVDDCLDVVCGEVRGGGVADEGCEGDDEVLLLCAAEGCEGHC